METYVAILLTACLYEISVFMFKGYFILQFSIHVCVWEKFSAVFLVRSTWLSLVILI